MDRWVIHWWKQLRIQHKVWAVLLLLCLPLVGGLGAHLYALNQLLNIQQQRHDLVLADNYVNLLRRLAVDVEDGFRGYVLTRQEAFLSPLVKAEARIENALNDARRALAAAPGLTKNLESVETHLHDLLRSKSELLADMRQGSGEQVLEYIRSGEGLRLSDRLREELLIIEDDLSQQRGSLNNRAEALSKELFVGLWFALAGVVLLGFVGSLLLARSLTDPIHRLQMATAKLSAKGTSTDMAEELKPVLSSGDELGDLANAYRRMARQISNHVRELEVLGATGQEINTIGPDGLDGVLRRITDRAVDLVRADVCLVLLRDDRMGCWIVEAASGELEDALKNSVMLWEELPVSVKAFETREVAVGEHFRTDLRPQVIRRNLIGDSMLAVPLLSQGTPFGVLALLTKQQRAANEWNQRLARGLAQEAALAISNARLYEAAQQKQKRLTARLRQLEYLAETLAHDLKGPGARMEELVKILVSKFPGQLDEGTKKWLRLIEENGSEIVRRVEGILEVARVGVGVGSVTAVDPGIIINDVLKAHAGDIERLQATVHVEPGFPLVACHGAYLRQVIDNLVSNALKYHRPGEPPALTIASQTDKHMLCIAVHDQGIGISVEQRSKIFEPFVRLGQGNAAGSGIGLAIVKRIVELYGGRAWVEGGEGGGCTVKFTLPCLKEEASLAGNQTFSGEQSEIVSMSHKEIL